MHTPRLLRPDLVGAGMLALASLYSPLPGKALDTAKGLEGCILWQEHVPLKDIKTCVYLPLGPTEKQVAQNAPRVRNELYTSITNWRHAMEGNPQSARHLPSSEGVSTFVDECLNRESRFEFDAYIRHERLRSAMFSVWVGCHIIDEKLAALKKAATGATDLSTEGIKQYYAESIRPTLEHVQTILRVEYGVR